MQILAKNQTKTKREAIADELAELQADGVQLAPGLTAQEILQAEGAGLVMDLATGMISGTENARYTITAKGLRSL